MAKKTKNCEGKCPYCNSDDIDYTEKSACAPERSEKMDEDTKQFIIQCIQQAKGDDLYRAKCAFRNLTQEEMNQEYGQSGKTRQQILDNYESYNKKCEDAIKTIQAIS